MLDAATEGSSTGLALGRTSLPSEPSFASACSSTTCGIATGLKVGFAIRRIVLGFSFDSPASLDFELAVADRAVDAAGRPDEEPLLDLEIALERACDVGAIHRHGAFEHAALHDFEQAPVGHRGFDGPFDGQTLAIEDRAAADGRLPTDGEPLGVALHAPRRIRRHGVGRAARHIRVEYDGLVGHVPSRSIDDDGGRPTLLATFLAPTVLFLISALASEHLFLRYSIAALLPAHSAPLARRLRRP